MTEVRKKFITAFVPIAGMLIWSFITMIKSLGTDESWRKIVSSAGFASFFLLTVLLLRQWWKEEKDDE